MNGIGTVVVEFPGPNRGAAGRRLRECRIMRPGRYAKMKKIHANFMRRFAAGDCVRFEFGTQLYALPAFNTNV
jgi:hypothetical protein